MTKNSLLLLVSLTFMLSCSSCGTSTNQEDITMDYSVFNVRSSDTQGGTPITEFPMGTDTVYVTYEYRNPIGAIQKITWYDSKDKVLGSSTHKMKYEKGTSTWSLIYPKGIPWPEGSYKADVYINDVSLASLSWQIVKSSA